MRKTQTRSRRLALCGVLGALAVASLSSMVESKSRPTDQIAADLGIKEQVFVACFANVEPDRNHAPTGAHQKANKAVLLPCLQAANPEITNAALDAVMDRYRPEGAMK